MIPLMAFWIVPTCMSLYYSLTDYSVVLDTHWVGLGNFVKMLDDDMFWHSMENSAYFTIGSVPLIAVVGLMLAMAVNAPIQFRNFFRVVFYMPLVTSTIALSMVWLWLFDPNLGLLNAMLGVFGIPRQLWLQSVSQAMPSIILMSVWGSVGGTMLIYLAGLQGIPDALYEAAEIDGANRWQAMRHITLPLITPTAFFAIIISSIGAFQIFDNAYVLTGGGPADASRTIVMYIYDVAFHRFEMGYASAIAVSLLLILVTLTLIQTWAGRRWVHYE